MRLRFILLTFWLSACGSDNKPENLIPEDKMAKILTEIHILEAQVTNLHFQHEDSSVFVYQRMKVNMLKKFNMDTATFKNSFQYYVINPDKMKGIYVEVKKQLEAQKKQIENKKANEDKKKKLIEDKKNKQIPEAVRKNDSLMRLKNEIKSKIATKKRLIINKSFIPKLNKAIPKVP